MVVNAIKDNSIGSKTIIQLIFLKPFLHNKSNTSVQNAIYNKLTNNITNIFPTSHL